MTLAYLVPPENQVTLSHEVNCSSEMQALQLIQDTLRCRTLYNQLFSGCFKDVGQDSKHIRGNSWVEVFLEDAKKEMEGKSDGGLVLDGLSLSRSSFRQLKFIELLGISLMFCSKTARNRALKAPSCSRS